MKYYQYANEAISFAYKYTNNMWGNEHSFIYQLINSNISQSKDDPRLNPEQSAGNDPSEPNEDEEVKDTIYGNLPKEESDT